MRALVIEDNEDTRDLVAYALREDGYEVRTASDGRAGWAALSDGSPLPDVVVLDLMMPLLDGRRFRVRQMADPELAAIPTVVITATRVDASVRQAIGDIPVVFKPVAINALLATVAAAVAPRNDDEKRCGCGAVYDIDAWRRLDSLGDVDNGRDVGERIELRNCKCGSTLAWEVGRHASSLHVRLE